MPIMSASKFEREIDAFLRRTRMKATNFGKVVMGDPNFVFDLRKKGRAPSLRLVEIAQTYMAGADILLKQVHALHKQRNGHANGKKRRPLRKKRPRK